MSLANHHPTFLRCFQLHCKATTTYLWVHLKWSLPFVIGEVQRKQWSPYKALGSDLCSWAIITEGTLQGHKLTSAFTGLLNNLDHWVCQHFPPRVEKSIIQTIQAKWKCWKFLKYEKLIEQNNSIHVLWERARKATQGTESCLACYSVEADNQHFS